MRVAAVRVAVVARDGDALCDELLLALKVVLLQQLGRVGVHNDELQAAEGTPDFGDHLLVALALHAVAVDKHQAVARQKPGVGGGSVGLHQADELAALRFLAVQVEAVAVGSLLHGAQSWSEVRHCCYKSVTSSSWVFFWVGGRKVTQHVDASLTRRGLKKHLLRTHTFLLDCHFRSKTEKVSQSRLSTASAACSVV